MIAPGPVIQLELNELTPRLMFQFMEQGKLPGFSRLFSESEVFTTDADETGTSLNPWIQWVTVHTGATLAEHGAFLLGEGGRSRVPFVGDVLADAGRSVWLCGSMNVRSRSDATTFLPDAWATDARPSPPELSAFFDVVQRHVLEHTGGDTRLGGSDYARFGAFLARHGLSSETVWATARQLLRERGGRFGWKRVTILDRLQFDLFRWFYRRQRPDFSSFFLNSVAHLQHTRWRNFEPERFDIAPTPEEQEEFRDAVLFGYQENDRIVSRFLELAGDNATLVFCTALSQQPDVRWEDSGGKYFYRPHDFGALADFAGIKERHECTPVMSEEFWLQFDTEAAALASAEALGGLQVEGEAAFRIDCRGRELYAGCRIFDKLPDAAELTNPTSGRRVPFSDLLYRAASVKSGVHHPDGLLWIRRPSRTHREHPGKVSLKSIAPTVLSLLGVEQPATMSGRPLPLSSV